MKLELVREPLDEGEYLVLDSDGEWDIHQWMVGGWYDIMGNPNSRLEVVACVFLPEMEIYKAYRRKDPERW